MSAPFHVLTPDAQYADDALVERRTAGDAVRWEIHRERDASRIPAESFETADALLVWHEVKIDAALIDCLRNCRIIVRAGVGFDHIDLEAAGRAGIPVCNTPDYGTSEVADHAIALMLAFKRGIPAYHDRLRQDAAGLFDAAAVSQVARIRGRRIAIIGLGRIGTATALRAKAFGMEVVGYDPYLPRGQEIALGVTRVDTLEEALDRADVVSLHTPLTAETRGMIGARAFGLMAPHAILVNTARGAIVDIDALWEALRMNEIAAAGLDVLPKEPPPDHPLIKAYQDQEDWIRDRLILTPHAAWISEASREDARRLSTETLVQYLVDGRLRNCVNEAWLPHDR